MTDNSNKPLVSVLITAYNRQNLIAEALESAITCSYRNIEIIVVDDCSKDNTWNVIQEFAKKDSRIRYYKNEKNLGDYPNRNRAASYARGEYMTYLDSDDKMLHDGLEKCMDAMLLFPEAGIGMHWAKPAGKAFAIPREEAIRHHFYKYAFLVIGPGGTVLKRSFFEQIKGYPEKYGPANDMYFNLKAASYSDVVLFPFDFYFYRIHGQQERDNWDSYVYNNYLFLKDALEELPMPLTDKEKKWVANKNKRRFVVTLGRYLRYKRNLTLMRSALKKSRFTVRDLFDSVFH